MDSSGAGLLAAIATIAATGALAAPASAGLLTMSAKDCTDGALTQPFKTWGDKAQYKLVGGGAFEPAATGWTLRGGAKVVSGNEPWKVGDSKDGTVAGPARRQQRHHAARVRRAR